MTYCTKAESANQKLIFPYCCCSCSTVCWWLPWCTQVVAFPLPSLWPCYLMVAVHSYVSQGSMNFLHSVGRYTEICHALHFPTKDDAHGYKLYFLAMKYELGSSVNHRYEHQRQRLLSATNVYFANGLDIWVLSIKRVYVNKWIAESKWNLIHRKA